MKEDDLTESMSRIKVELDIQKNENLAMREFFDELAIPILKKAARNVERQLRKFPKEACLFGDDSKLNFFEEVCVMSQEASLDDYELVEGAIAGCCESAYDELSYREKFIIDHQTISDFSSGCEMIKDEFVLYVTYYENKKIKDAIERGLLTD